MEAEYLDSLMRKSGTTKETGLDITVLKLRLQYKLDSKSHKSHSLLIKPKLVHKHLVIIIHLKIKQQTKHNLIININRVHKHNLILLHLKIYRWIKHKIHRK